MIPVIVARRPNSKKERENDKRFQEACQRQALRFLESAAAYFQLDCFTPEQLQQMYEEWVKQDGEVKKVRMENADAEVNAAFDRLGIVLAAILTLGFSWLFGYRHAKKPEPKPEPALHPAFRGMEFHPLVGLVVSDGLKIGCKNGIIKYKEGRYSLTQT